MNQTDQLISALADLLTKKQLRLATAESCTGGGIAHVLTSLPGSSNWFDAGFVTYSNEAKQSMLGVNPETLEQDGAVSEAVVCEMVFGTIANSQADLAVAVSGVAGPDGGTPDKPVGTVWIAWGRKGGEPFASRFLFQGDRQVVRRAAVAQSIEGLLSLLKEKFE